MLRKLFWVFLVGGLTGLCVWIVIGPWFRGNHLRFPEDAGTISLLAVLFVTPNLGTIWMLYESIRHENHPLPFSLLAFVPYSFLWYYFERVRIERHLTET